MDREMDPTEKKLCEDVKQCLKEKLFSIVEAEVLELFEKKKIIDTAKQKPKQPDVVELINMLISEYMESMGYKMTNSMFMKELGTEFKASMCRKQMSSILDLEDNNESLQLPLLTVLITMFKNKNGDNIS